MDTSSIRQIGAPAPETTPAAGVRAPQADPRPDRRQRPAALLVGLLDGALGVALPLGVLAVVAVIGWAGLGSGAPWTAAVGVAAVAWLLGHGVDVVLPGPPAVTVTAAALGPALVTAALAFRAGGRAGRTAAPTASWIAGVVAVLTIATALVLPLATAVAAPAVPQAIALPTLLWAGASLLGLRRARGVASRLPDGVRAGIAATGLLVAAAGVLLAVLLAVRFPEVIALTEALAPGGAGGLALTGLQLLLLPTAVVWTAAWTTGAAVTLGTGSATGAFGSQLGPLPTLPLLGVVPADPPPFAAAVLLLPVLAGFVAGLLVGRGGAGALRTGAVAGPVAGLLLGALTAASAGAAGPGRLGQVGPDALLVLLLTMLEVGLPAMLGAAVARRRPPAEGPEPADR